MMAGLDAYLVPVVDGVAYGLLLLIASTGLMLVFAVGGVLNLTHGVMFSLGAYLAATLSDGSWTASAIAVLVGAVAGAGGGSVLAAALAPLRHRDHLTQALLTMGVAFIGVQLLSTVFGPADRSTPLPRPLAGTVDLFGSAYPTYRIVMIGVGAVVAVGLWWVLAQTRWGALVRATVDDPAMVSTLGVNPRAVRAGVMAAGGGLAGLAGALGAPIIGAGPTTATTVLLMSLVVVVLGGMRSVPATVVAALGVGQVQTLGVVVFPLWAPFLLFAAMAIVLVARGRGDGMPA